MHFTISDAIEDSQREEVGRYLFSLRFVGEVVLERWVIPECLDKYLSGTLAMGPVQSHCVFRATVHYVVVYFVCLRGLLPNMIQNGYHSGQLPTRQILRKNVQKRNLLT